MMKHFLHISTLYSHIKYALTLLLALIVPLFLGGCQSAYYSTMEQFGVEKRDILVDRVGEAREAQHKATTQFESALEEFSALTQFDGGDLKKQYDQLKKEFARSEDRAGDLRDRIDSVEHVGKDLFIEWKKEIDQYSDNRFREQSRSNMKQTEAKYNQLMTIMQRSETRIQPVLDAFRDRVLYLKHNLNARALTSLRGDVEEVKSDVGLLIEDMKRAIQEADRFLSEMS